MSRKFYNIIVVKFNKDNTENKKYKLVKAVMAFYFLSIVGWTRNVSNLLMAGALLEVYLGKLFLFF